MRVSRATLWQLNPVHRCPSCGESRGVCGRSSGSSRRGPYVAGVDFKLYQQRDGAYREVYSGGPNGPWFYARVTPGRYRVEATYGGVTRTRELQVGASQKAAQIVMQWDVADDGR